MTIEHRLRNELRGVLRDAGLRDHSAHADILDLDFENQLGLGSIERAELLLRIEKACAITLPKHAVQLFRSPRDLLLAIDDSQRIEASGNENNSAEFRGLTSPSLTPGLPLTVPAQSTLLDLIRLRAESNGAHPHLHFLRPDGQLDSLTYRRLWDQGRRAAAGVATRGLRRGDRVAILALTGPEFFVAFVAVLCAGGVPVPIYPPVRPSDLLGYVERQSRILANAGVILIVSDPLFESAAQLLCAATPSLQGAATVDSLIKEASADLYCVESPAELALIQYTSGSTGSPKGVALTHANLLANVRAISEGNLDPTDVAVSWMPLYHDFGLIACWMGAAIFTGASVVLMSPMDFLMKPSSWLWAIHRFRATVIATPAFGLDFAARRISDEEISGLDMSSVRLVVLGAEPIRPKTLDDFCQRFAPHGFSRNALAPAYGLAESCVAVTLAPGRDHGPRLDHVDHDRLATEGRAEVAIPGSRAQIFVSLGKPIGDQEIQIADATGSSHQPVPERREGRVLVRGSSIMQGYFANPEATAAARIDDWLDTGDLGYLADGELFITGRAKDLIIKGGRNYHPHDIEYAAGQLPGVRKGCVIAFGDDLAEHGERIVVVAEANGTAPAHDELVRSIRATVVATTGASVDDVVLIPRGTMLKTSSGKLRRQDTRRRYREGNLGESSSRRWQLAAVAAQLGANRIGRSARALTEVTTGAYIAAVASSSVLAATASAPLLEDSTSRWAFNRKILDLMWRTTGITFRRTGAPLPKEQALYVSNHPSEMDALLIMSTFETPVRISAYYYDGLFAAIASRLGVIPIEPPGVGSPLESYEQLRKVLAQGESVHIFPEGGHPYNPGIYPFRLGAFKLAASENIPIVPLALRGPHEVMRGKPYRPASLEVEVLPAVWLDCDPSDLAALATARTAVRKAIARACGEPLIDSVSPASPLENDGSIVTRIISWSRLVSKYIMRFRN